MTEMNSISRITGMTGMTGLKDFLPAALMSICLVIFCYGGLYAEAHKYAGKWVYVTEGFAREPQNVKYLILNPDGFNVLCFTGYRIDRFGNISINPDLTEISIELNVKSVDAIPMLTPASARDGALLLASDVNRKSGIESIIRLVRSTNSSGIHIDFEYFPPSKAAEFSVFLRDLRSRIRAISPGIILSMALFPRIDFPEKWSGFHDYTLLAPCLDKAVLMCYDYHRSDTLPGPVTDIRWAERNIKELLRYMKPEKVWLGIPAYGYSWRNDGKVQVISARSGAALARKHSGSRDPSGTVRIEYREGKYKFKAYFSDAETRRRLTELAIRYKLHGTALWRLGLED